MSQPYVGQITLFAGNFAPVGYAFCDGSEVSISEYEALYNVIGTTYGGNGQTTFALPDLRGRVPVHQGQGTGLSAYVIGQIGGVETVTLTTNQMPTHNHAVPANTAAGTQNGPANGVLAAGTSITRYVSDPPATAMSANTVANQGGSQPHENHQPYQCISFIIALTGIYPSQG